MMLSSLLNYILRLNLACEYLEYKQGKERSDSKSSETGRVYIW